SHDPGACRAYTRGQNPFRASWRASLQSSGAFYLFPWVRRCSWTVLKPSAPDWLWRDRWPSAGQSVVPRGWSPVLRPFVPVGLLRDRRWPHAAETADPCHPPSSPAPQRLPSATIRRSPRARQRILSLVSLDVPYRCAWRTMLAILSL